MFTGPDGPDGLAEEATPVSPVHRRFTASARAS